MKFRKLAPIIFLFVCSCTPENQAPRAEFSCSPEAGSIRTLFDLNASESYDPDGLKNLLRFRWDLDGDGNWDTPFGSFFSRSCSFSEPGIYTIRMEVIDTEGGTAQSSFSIHVDSLHHMTDPRDGQVYPVIRLGSNWWMGRNLDIGTVLDPSVDPSNNGIIEKFVYPGGPHADLYGGLYTWAEMMNYGYEEGSRGICPPGWRIPTDSDWKDLFSLFRAQRVTQAVTYWITGEKFIPDQKVVHNNYQTAGAVEKLLLDTGGTGFDAVLAGYRDPDGGFSDRDYHFTGHTTTFWSSTLSGDNAIRVRLYRDENTDSDVIRFADNRRYAFSVRCVRNDQ
jgi:uncharacterized protein (TIGR02145 family)